MNDTALSGLIHLDYEVSQHIYAIEGKVLRSRNRSILMAALIIGCSLLTWICAKGMNQPLSTGWLICFAGATICAIAAKAFVDARRRHKDVRMEMIFQRRIAEHVCASTKPLAEVFREKLSSRLTLN